jgi:DNA-binding MarR family transcriptional regulator
MSDPHRAHRPVVQPAGRRAQGPGVAGTGGQSAPTEGSHGRNRLLVRGQELEKWPTHRLLSTAARLDEREINRSLMPLRLTKAALEALEAIAGSAPTKLSDLAAQLCVTPQSLGKTLRRLQDLGLLTKEPGKDRRSATIDLTKHGRDVLLRAEDLVQALSQDDAGTDIALRNYLQQRIHPPGDHD